MLYYETIDAQTLGLLKNLLSTPAFSGLRLAGGTSLALQYGHRKSVDLDLFGSLEIDSITLSGVLSGFNSVKRISGSQNIHVFAINGIKVDLVNYPYPWLEDILEVDGLRLATPKDIGAMKLAAISGRGTRKDFVDLFYLLKRYSLRDLLTCYEEKYADGSVFLVLKSMIYFNDAELMEMPIMLDNTNWDTIKAHISLVHRNYLTEM